MACTNHTLSPEKLTVNSICKISEIRLQPKHAIEQRCWQDFQGGPLTTFQIAHCNGQLVILFTVHESNPRAEHAADMEQVCQDSCVEFFCRVPALPYYYNFELNSLGALLASRRIKRKEDVHRFTPDELAQIGRQPSIFPDRWELLLTIPFASLGVDKMPERICGNFYKCGDLTGCPHYLTWKRIETPSPDFHRPEYFGDIIFNDFQKSI